MIPGPQQTRENPLLLADVVVHSAIAFNGMDLDILKPFNAIVNSPAELKVVFYTIIITIIVVINVVSSTQNAFLPTMPDDSLPDVRRALGGTFYGMCCKSIELVLLLLYSF